MLLRMILCLLACFSPILAQASENDVPSISGRVSEVTSPDLIWLGAITIRLHGVKPLSDRRDEAVAYLRDVAMDQRLVCDLHGERPQPVSDQLVGRCRIIDPESEEALDLSAHLIAKGVVRACVWPAATIAIWPPVYICN